MINRTKATESLYDLILKLMLSDDVSLGVENHSGEELIFEYYMIGEEYQLNIYKKSDIDSGLVIPNTNSLCTMQNFYLSMNLNDEEDTKNESL